MKFKLLFFALFLCASGFAQTAAVEPEISFSIDVVKEDSVFLIVRRTWPATPESKRPTTQDQPIFFPGKQALTDWMDKQRTEAQNMRKTASDIERSTLKIEDQVKLAFKSKQ